MQLHEIPSRTKPKKRVGRGGKKGTYSGRGMKGQKSRAGANMQPIVRELLKRYPKMRGKGVHKKSTHNSVSQEVVNVRDIEKHFEEGALVNPENLLKKRLVKRINGRIPRVKILSLGKVTKAFTVENCEVSAPAKTKILAAKGQVVSSKKEDQQTSA